MFEDSIFAKRQRMEYKYSLLFYTTASSFVEVELRAQQCYRQGWVDDVRYVVAAIGTERMVRNV